MRLRPAFLASAALLAMSPAYAQSPQVPISQLPVSPFVNGQTDYAVAVVLRSTAGIPTYVTSRVPITALQGPAGLGATFSSVSVATLAPGSMATATLGGTAPNYTLALGIPQGQAGNGTGNVNTTGTPAVGQLAYYPTTSGNSIAPLATAIPINLGGTGGATASAARSGLGAAASGNNSDITSLLGLATPLSVSQGGTGATSVLAARTSLSAAASGVNTDITSLASPALGSATATTQTASDNSTKVATTAQVQAAIAAVASGGGAPSAVNALSSAYTVQANDKGKTLLLTGSFTVTEPACSSNAGFYFWVKKADGSGVVQLTSAGGTTDGLSTKSVYQESFLEWCDGTNWRSQGRSKGWINVGTTTVSTAVASVNFTTGFSDPELRDMEFDVGGLTPSASDAINVLVQKSGTYQTSGYNSATLNGYNNSTVNTGSNTTSFKFANYASASAEMGTFKIGMFASATAQFYQSNSYTVGNTTITTSMGTHTGVSAAITGVQIMMAGGSNIASGTIAQKGFRP